MILSICEANRLLCHFFDETTQTLQKYCEEYNGELPTNCTRGSNLVDKLSVDRVENLKIVGCSEFIVLDAVERYINIRTLDISYSQYRTLNWLDLSLKRLQKFNASHNEISSIWMLFENVPEIREIDFSYNRLTTINGSTFGRVEKLEMIYLSQNALKDIANDTFSNASHLQMIDLNDNHISRIPVFSNAKHLKTIHIKRNRITAFNYCLYTKMNAVSIYFTLKYVTSFYRDENCDGKFVEPLQVIWDNKYEGVLLTTDGNYEIHFNEDSFQNLYTFVAGHNAYANVMDLLHHFGTLITKIDLSGNMIGQQPDATTFERFNDLSTLILHDTHLMDFDFSWLTNQNYRLKMLDVSNNNLKFIKSVWLLDDFRVLRELIVAGNQLANLPELIQHIRSPIEKLNLSGNFVGQLNTTTFQRLTALKALNLSRTSLSISESDPFERLSELTILDISYNRLKNVNLAILSRTLGKLNKLYASHCEIENISQLVSYLRSSIKELDLSGNYMGMFNVRAFENLINLEFLNLSNIHMFYFDFYALKQQKLLQTLDVSWNKLQDVDLEPLRGNLKCLHLNGNDLRKVDHLNRIHFPHLITLTIHDNQLPCDYLKQLLNDWNGLEFIKNPLNQKNNIDCGSKTQAVSDFFNNVYDTIKFW